MTREEKILEDFQAGQSFAQLEMTYNMKKQNLKRILKNQGVTDFPRGKAGRPKCIPDIHPELGRKLYVLRSDPANGALNAKVFAEKADINWQEYACAERGGEITLSQLKKIAKVLGVTVKDLV